jgi:RNA-directed DNA polymerase
VISPLLANIALHVLDVAWARGGSRLGKLIRFADDFVVLCASQPRVDEARRRVAAILTPLGLRLHPDKTRIVQLTGGAQGFDFLGFHLRKVASWKWRGRYDLQLWPSARAMARIRAKIREATERRQASRPVGEVIADLNRVLRGWGTYFRVGNSAAKFADVDGYVHRRLARLVNVKHGRSGLSWAGGGRHNYAWFASLPVYRLSGRVRYPAAHALR